MDFLKLEAKASGAGKTTLLSRITNKIIASSDHVVVGYFLRPIYRVENGVSTPAGWDLVYVNRPEVSVPFARRYRFKEHLVEMEPDKCRREDVDTTQHGAWFVDSQAFIQVVEQVALDVDDYHDRVSPAEKKHRKLVVIVDGIGPILYGFAQRKVPHKETLLNFCDWLFEGLKANMAIMAFDNNKRRGEMYFKLGYYGLKDRKCETTVNQVEINVERNKDLVHANAIAQKVVRCLDTGRSFDLTSKAAYDDLRAELDEIRI